jgi:two-component system cell cycle response regulator
MPPNILVIDNNADNVDLVAYLLRARGYAPRVASSGAAGVRTAVEDPPDLILLDISMPDMDGYAVAAALKPRPALEGTRIVAVTAFAMVEDRERIATAGFDGYIQKPIDPELFVDQLSRFLPVVSAGATVEVST